MENGYSLYDALIVVAIGGLVATLFMVIWGVAQRRWKTPFRVGDEMRHARVDVVEWAGGEGMVSADGELWRAISPDPIKPGDTVEVARVDGLTLEVRRKH